jgi:hypothetical protein
VIAANNKVPLQSRAPRNNRNGFIGSVPLWGSWNCDHVGRGHHSFTDSALRKASLIDVYDAAGENVIEVSPVQSPRAFGV